MSTTPQRSTVVVHSITGRDHSVLAFPEVALDFKAADSVEVESWGVYYPSRISDTVYTLTGTDGYTMTTGGTAEEAYAEMIAAQGCVTTALRKERDDAIRERNKVESELARLKRDIRNVVDPPEPEPDEDEDDGYCEQCHDYHDYGGEE